MIQKKERIVNIDYLKVFALLIVLNSHMELCYHPYEFLATGGAIGDALFFFCSGFTLFLGNQQDFFNYYKRRISRIYPTVFTVGILGCIIWGENKSIYELLISGGGWFVSCIMIYYVVLYFIRRYMLKKLNLVWIFISALILLWYYILPFDGFIYGIGSGGIDKYFRWLFYFMFMLQGAIIGMNANKYKFDKFAIIKLIGSIFVWYAFAFLRTKYKIVDNCQYISLIPLLGITYYSYIVCSSKYLEKIYKMPVFNQLIYIIGGLCLESYLIQRYIFTDKLNFLFPLNIPIIMILVLISSYLVNFVSNVFAQTFQKEDYDFKRCLMWKYK